jgi:hypothetical protein
MPDIFISEDNLIEKGSTDWDKKNPEKKQPVGIDRGKQEKELEKEQEKQIVINSPIGPFSAFKVRPRGIHFNEQDEDEYVLLILRKHIVTNIPWIIFSAFLLIAPFVFFSFFNLSDFFINVSIPAKAYSIFIYAYYLVVFCYMFVAYITWHYNASLITNKKVVDVHFQDILYHDVKMTKINLIEDVNYVQSGLLGSFFGYGDVFIETAGKSLRFDFYSVPNPQRVVNLLENIIGGNHAE